MSIPRPLTTLFDILVPYGGRIRGFVPLYTNDSLGFSVPIAAIAASIRSILVELSSREDCRVRLRNRILHLHVVKLGNLTL